jgi:hypothetical protein
VAAILEDRALRRRVPFGVKLAGVLCVLGRMQVVPVREVRVVGGLVVRLLAVVRGGMTVVLGRGLVMFRRLFVMLGQFRRVHERLPSAARAARPRRDEIPTG